MGKIFLHLIEDTFNVYYMNMNLNNVNMNESPLNKNEYYTIISKKMSVHHMDYKSIKYKARDS